MPKKKSKLRTQVSKNISTRKRSSRLSRDVEAEHDATEIKPKKKQKISQLSSFIQSFSKSPSPSDHIAVKEPPVNSSDDGSENELQSDQWYEKYAPQTSSAVSLHSRKKSDVVEELTSMLSHDSQIKMLILSGPAGTSKSTIIKTLSKEMIPRSEKPFIEWINQSENNSSQFEDFLNSAKYRVGRNLSFILIEDIPNVFHNETREIFQRVLSEWIHTSTKLPPLILSITECEISRDENTNGGYNIENNYTVETIVGRSILNNSAVRRIKFNPVNANLIRKCLNEISLKTKINKTKSQIKEEIEKLVTFGDIRSAISAFQFWAQSKNLNTIDFGKESTTSYFHAIGKCIFGTKIDDEDDRSAMISVMKDFSTRSSILKLGLLENYTKYNASNYPLENAAEIVDGYSLSDTIAPDAVSLEMAIRYTRNNLADTSRSGTTRGLNFPREWKVTKSIYSTRKGIEKYIELEMKRTKVYRAFQDSNLLFGFYEPLINKQKAFKNTSKVFYLKSKNELIPHDLYEPKPPYLRERLGGGFNEILGDKDMVPDDEVKLVYEGNEYANYQQNDENDNDDDYDDLEFEEDPIVDSNDEDDHINGDSTNFGLDDTFEEELLHLSQRPKITLNSQIVLKRDNSEFFNDFDDDDDFDD